MRRQPPWLWLFTGVALVCLACLSASVAALEPALNAWPPPQVHSLPPSLASLALADAGEAGDYFEAVNPPPVGHLIWSSFPVKVYLEPTPQDPGWAAAIRQAMQEWSVYLPLVEVTDPGEADILWHYQVPPFRVRLDRQRRELIIADSRAAEARFQVYWQPGSPPRLAHRFTILLTPRQGDRHTLGTARHELGHALGLWGHSPEPTDVLYAAQVREPPPISARDRQTLYKVYTQPTRLGWPQRLP